MLEDDCGCWRTTVDVGGRLWMLEDDCRCWRTTVDVGGRL